MLRDVLDGSLDLAIRSGAVRSLDAHAPGDGGANRFRVKDRALNGARFDHFGREIFQRGLGAETKPQAFHSSEQAPLAMPDFQEHRHQFGLIPDEMRPIRLLMDVPHGNIITSVCGEYKA